MIISLITIFVYTGVSLRLAYAKRLMITEKLEDLKGSKKPKRDNKAEASGWCSKWVPHVSNLAWSTLDLVNLYVSLN